MPEEQLTKLSYKILTPVRVEWNENSKLDKQSSILFLDLSAIRAYDADGNEVEGQVVNQVFQSIRGSTKFEQPKVASVVYDAAMSLQQKIYEENEELIDGTKRSESGRIRAWSGEPGSGDPTQLGQQEDSEIHSEAGSES